MSSTNQTHTPEPWLVEKYGRGYSVYTRENDYRIIADCKARDGHELESCEANAHLIASAPDMLRTLERWARWFEQFGGADVAGIACDTFAAIRKARNQSKEE